MAAAYVKKIVAMLPSAKRDTIDGQNGARSVLGAKDLPPPVDSDGVIVPSVRMTASGLVPVRPATRYTRPAGKVNLRFPG